MGNTSWTRAHLKQRAKGKLKTFYLQAFLVCLIAMMLGAGTSGADFSSAVNIGGGSGNGSGGNGMGFSVPFLDGGFSMELVVGILIMLVTVVAVIAVALCFTIFLSNAVKVGKCRYFLKMTAGDQGTGISELFSVFTSDYRNMVYVMFRCGLSVFLWTLLLIVPGIVKAYQYCLVPYILAEEPGISWIQARERSMELMQDNKMAVFMLQMSFIGWDILGAIMCGIGYIFVAPYKEAVYAELYYVLKGKGSSMQKAYPELEF